MISAVDARPGDDPGPIISAPPPADKATITMEKGQEREKAASTFWSIDDHPGADYLSALSVLHKRLQPKSYLEIGTMSGESLSLASCPSIAIDPDFHINGDITGRKPFCLLFQMRSDTFFGTYNPKTLFGSFIEMAFLDGLHLFEVALRDFINIEKFSKRNSVILIHDCIPTDAYIGRRVFEDHTLLVESRHRDWWAGDTWKLLLILKRYRPDLQVHAFNAAPTGLATVTNLDPASELLSNAYFDIVSQYRTLDLGEYGIKKFLRELNVMDTAILASFESVSALFWL